MPEGRLKRIGPEDPITKMAWALAENSELFATRFGVSRMNVCEAFANAVGMIMASSKDMPREEVLRRMDDLCLVMKTTYELGTVQGSG